VPRVDAIRSAAQDFVSAALLGDGWEETLSRFSFFAGARGAALMRNEDYRIAGVIASPEIKEPVIQFLAGRVPPTSRQIRACQDPAKGFRFDHDDYSDDDLSRDPYYQEFLRPIGYFWHAAVRLDADPGNGIALSLKRPLKAGPYERQDAIPLNSVLPDLRAAARIARRIVQAEAGGAAKLLHSRGDPVFELDASGKVLRTHVFRDDPTRPVRILRRRLIANDRLAQPTLDRAIAIATTSPGAPAIVSLADAAGTRYFLQIVPVGGRACDVFLAATAVAVLINVAQRGIPLNLERDTLRTAFALTDREVEVAIALAGGLSVADIAKRLRIQVGTTRDYLKSVFEKTGTCRQAELVALLGSIKF